MSKLIRLALRSLYGSTVGVQPVCEAQPVNNKLKAIADVTLSFFIIISNQLNKKLSSVNRLADLFSLGNSCFSKIKTCQHKTVFIKIGQLVVEQAATGQMYKLGLS
jgi:hypothetical protein